MVSRHSDPFGTFIKTPMIESGQGYVELTDLKAETFHSFAQWMYQGFYTAPDPVVMIKHDENMVSNVRNENKQGDGLMNENPTAKLDTWRELFAVVDNHIPEDRAYYTSW